jgi:proline iminopeptidase
MNRSSSRTRSHTSSRAIPLLALGLWACGARTGSPPVPAAPPALAAGPRLVKASDGSELHLHVAGHGPVCLFVHGGPGQDSLSFEQMGGSALEPFVTMVYLDQRGSGTSPDASNYHLDRIVQDFEEVRQALGVDKLCLIAHSFGGVLAVAYANRHPAQVSELVLANATLQFLGPSQMRMQTTFINELLGRTRPLPPDSDTAGLTAARDDAWSALMHSDQGYRVLTDHLATVQKMNAIEGSYPRSHGFGAAVIEQRAAVPEYYADYAPMSARIAQPVLVITSARDYAVGPDEYKRFRFPHQQVVMLDGGHISYYDANAAFTAAIRGFLRGRSQ